LRLLIPTKVDWEESVKKEENPKLKLKNKNAVTMNKNHECNWCIMYEFYVPWLQLSSVFLHYTIMLVVSSSFSLAKKIETEAFRAVWTEAGKATFSSYSYISEKIWFFTTKINICHHILAGRKITLQACICWTWNEEKEI
jgi:hypothetical protein